MERICVFLSSKANLPENYVQAAIDVATWIGKSGRTLVYGGSRAGLMETLAITVREKGNTARVVGKVDRVDGWLHDGKLYRCGAAGSGQP